MELFSKRRGLEKPKVKVQIDNIDDDLRISLWNGLTIHFFDKLTGKWLYNLPKTSVLIISLWIYYFKKPIDELSNWGNDINKELKNYFFSCSWDKVYSLIEFVVANYPANEDETTINSFFDYCNGIFESEVAGYRFVGGEITQITSKQEIEEIEEALATSLTPIQEHLKRSLNLLSDKKSPDYRNSIKEAISAVEAICKLISKNDKATLGDALNEIEKSKKIEVHPALKGAFNKMYGYTNDEEGIRHSLIDKENVDFEDAKFMLVSCSAFINYLIVKSSKVGIKI